MPKYNGWHASYIPSISTPISSFSIGISYVFVGNSLFELSSKIPSIFSSIITSSSTIENTFYTTQELAISFMVGCLWFTIYVGCTKCSNIVSISTP